MKLQRWHLPVIIILLIAGVGSIPFWLMVAENGWRSLIRVLIAFSPVAVLLALHFRAKNKQYREEQRVKKWIEKKPWSN